MESIENLANEIIAEKFSNLGKIWIFKYRSICDPK
jgi:hypothetical protein